MINDELRAIQSVLNETSRAGNEGAVPVTLIIGGQVITGFLVSQSVYQRAREDSAADELTKRVALALNKVDAASPAKSKQLQHVYLRAARFVLPDIRVGASVIKLAIDAIDGFMFGIEGDDEGLVLGGAPVLPGASESGSREVEAAANDSQVGRRGPRAELAETLRELARALDAGEALKLRVGEERVDVPVGAASISIGHEQGDDGHALTIAFRW